LIKKKKKMTTTHYRLLLWCYWNKKGDDNKLTLLFYLLVCLIWWFLGVYRVQDITKEEFVTNAVQVEMQWCHLYIARHAAKVANAKFLTELNTRL
jgi:hypothetical protein